jgi:RNA polymerase sigma-70 factor, ECF subfamily
VIQRALEWDEPEVLAEKRFPADEMAAPGTFEALVRAEFRYVWRLLRRLGLSETDADDAAQQVFVIASLRFLDMLAGRERAFLYGTALNVAGKWRRAARRELESSKNDEPLTDSSDPADELVDRRRARVMLDEILSSMPLELRAVLVLYEIEGQTAAEIAEITGLSRGTVASRLRRAREEFAEHVKRRSAHQKFRAERAGKERP